MIKDLHRVHQSENNLLLANLRGQENRMMVWAECHKLQLLKRLLIRKVDRQTTWANHPKSEHCWCIVRQKQFSMFRNLFRKINTNLNNKFLGSRVDYLNFPNQKYAHSLVVYDCFQTDLFPIRKKNLLIDQFSNCKFCLINMLLEFDFHLEWLDSF